MKQKYVCIITSFLPVGMELQKYLEIYNVKNVIVVDFSEKDFFDYICSYNPGLFLFPFWHREQQRVSFLRRIKELLPESKILTYLTGFDSIDFISENLLLYSDRIACLEPKKFPEVLKEMLFSQGFDSRETECREKREHSRFKVHFSVDEPVSGRTEDISARGLKIRFDEKIPVDQVQNISVITPAEKLTLKVKPVWQKDSHIGLSLENDFMENTIFQNLKAKDQKTIRKV